MDVVLGLMIAVALFVGATVLGGLIYLGAVWLNAHKGRRGPGGRYSAWVNRKADEIDAKANGRSGP